MTFIRFSVGFVNQKFSATAMVDGTLKDPKKGRDGMIEFLPWKTVPCGTWGTQVEAETSLGGPYGDGSQMVRLGRCGNRAALLVYSR